MASVAYIDGLRIPVDAFTFAIDTSLGDGTAAFHLPLSGAVSFTVYWGDGNSDTITSDTDPAMDHTYASGGTYDIILDGTIGTWNTGTVTDRTKVTDVKKWSTNFLLGDFRDFTGLTSDTATDYPSVSNWNNFFERCNNFNGDVSNWNTTGITDTTEMFRDASSFNIDISGWDVSNVTIFEKFLQQATSFNQDLSGWTPAATNMRQMFYLCSSFDADLDSWDMTNITDMRQMFSGTSFNNSLNSWSFPLALSLQGLFQNSDMNSDISSWTVSSITDFSSCFQNTPFNQDITGWNVSSGENFSQMFNGATAFNQNIGSWTVSSGTNFSEMFKGATAFNQNISSWNVSTADDFELMFNGASAFNQDISGWTTSNVTNMFEMFNGASAFAQDLSSWDVSNVVNLQGVFRSTQSDFDYSTWQLHSATTIRRAWLGNVISAANVSACLIGWEADTLTATGVNATECFSGISMSETTYATAKAAFDNLILAVGSGGYGWDLTGAINWTP